MLHKAPILMISRVYPSQWRFSNAFLRSVLVSALLTPLAIGGSGSFVIDGMLLVIYCICCTSRNATALGLEGGLLRVFEASVESAGGTFQKRNL